MSGNSSSSDSYDFYPYTPNTTLPIVVAIVFCVAFVYHLALSLMKGSFGYWWAWVVGILMEAVGYFAREESAKHPIGKQYEKWFIIQNTLIILAPALLAASMYMTYGRVIRFVGPEHSPVKKAARIFVCCDVASFLVQGLGAGMFTSHNSNTAKMAKTVLVVGFLVQIAAFSIFLILSVVFKRRTINAGVKGAGWSRVLYGLWFAGVLILIRSVYRLLEFATSSNADSGFLITHEVLFYLFDPLLVVIAIAALSILHPSFYLPRNKDQTLEPVALPPPVSQPMPYKGYY